MGAFIDIFAEVKERLGGRTTIDARITRWINDAYFDILMTPQYTFHELDSVTTFNTVANQRIYTPVHTGVPSNLMWFILMLRDVTNQREIRKKDIKELERRVETTGEPTRYARFSLDIYLDPTPNAVYSIRMRYRRRTGELIANGSTVLGREWDEPIILLSTVKGYEALEQPQKAERQLQLYGAAMARREEQHGLEDMDAEPTIGPWLGQELP
jgi:hypothetical protein